MTTISKKVDTINQHIDKVLESAPTKLKVSVNVNDADWQKNQELFAKERNGRPYKCRGISVRSILCLPMNGRMFATTNIMVAILVIWYRSDSCLESGKMTNRLVLGFHLKSVGCT